MNTGWLDRAVAFEGVLYRYQALAFGQGSRYGIDGGRVSILYVWPLLEAATRTCGPAVYGWDRGPEHDTAPAGLVAAVLADIDAPRRRRAAAVAVAA